MQKILKNIFDEKVIDVLSEIQGKKTVGVRDVSRKTKIPVSTVHRIFKKLENAKLLEKKKAGNINYYEVNEKSKAYAIVEKIVPKKTPIEIFTTIVSKEKTEEIYLLDKGNDRASMLVVGNVKNEKIQEICEVIKKEFAYSIKPLVLTKNQYENMSSLNMGPTIKKKLYKK